MENTLENRLKFYAQHLGQNIIIDSDCFSSESGNDIIHTTLVSVSLKGIECDGWIPVTEHTALERKPLSSITDEDAKTVATIFNYKEYNALEATRDWCKSISINTRNYFSAFHANYIHAFQFLISKSYALPWMGLSVDQLEEYGWIKLKK